VIDGPDLSGIRVLVEGATVVAETRDSETTLAMVTGCGNVSS
jgi:hypothetical protein